MAAKELRVAKNSVARSPAATTAERAGKQLFPSWETPVTERETCVSTDELVNRACKFGGADPVIQILRPRWSAVSVIPLPLQQGNLGSAGHQLAGFELLVGVFRQCSFGTQNGRLVQRFAAV
jgi:hypothetical protein